MVVDTSRLDSAQNRLAQVNDNVKSTELSLKDAEAKLRVATTPSQISNLTRLVTAYKTNLTTYKTQQSTAASIVQTELQKVLAAKAREPQPVFQSVIPEIKQAEAQRAEQTGILVTTSPEFAIGGKSQAQLEAERKQAQLELPSIIEQAQVAPGREPLSMPLADLGLISGQTEREAQERIRAEQLMRAKGSAQESQEQATLRELGSLGYGGQESKEPGYVLKVAGEIPETGYFSTFGTAQEKVPASGQRPFGQFVDVGYVGLLDNPEEQIKRVLGETKSPEFLQITGKEKPPAPTKLGLAEEKPATPIPLFQEKQPQITQVFYGESQGPKKSPSIDQMFQPISPSNLFNYGGGTPTSPLPKSQPKQPEIFDLNALLSGGVQIGSEISRRGSEQFSGILGELQSLIIPGAPKTKKEASERKQAEQALAVKAEKQTKKAQAASAASQIFDPIFNIVKPQPQAKKTKTVTKQSQSQVVDKAFTNAISPPKATKSTYNFFNQTAPAKAKAPAQQKIPTPKPKQASFIDSIFSPQPKQPQKQSQSIQDFDKQIRKLIRGGL